MEGSSSWYQSRYVVLQQDARLAINHNQICTDRSTHWNFSAVGLGVIDESQISQRAIHFPLVILYAVYCALCSQCFPVGRDAQLGDGMDQSGFIILGRGQGRLATMGK